MKNVSFGGGTLNFKIQDDWIEEEISDGGSMYYPPNKDTPTLRLNVMTFESQEEENSISIEAHLRKRAKKDSNVQKVANGNLLTTDTNLSNDHDANLRVFFWELAHLYPPHHFQLAIFSLTTFEKESPGGNLPKEYQWVEEEIKQVQFSNELRTP